MIVNNGARGDSILLPCGLYSQKDVKMEESSVIWDFDQHGLKIKFESEMTVWYAGSCFTTQKWQRSQNVKSIYGVKIKDVHNN